MTQPSRKQRPEHQDYYSPADIDLWLDEFTKEFYYILDLVKFSYKMLLPYYLELAKASNEDILTGGYTVMNFGFKPGFGFGTRKREIFSGFYPERHPETRKFLNKTRNFRKCLYHLIF